MLDGQAVRETLEAAPTSSRTYATAIAAGAAMAGLLFGFDTSTLNAAITGIRSTMDLTSGVVGFVAAISLIGCAIGAWFAGPIANRIGRTGVMTLAGSFIALGALSAAGSGHFVLLGGARLVSGIGIGAASAVVPPYIAEISPTEVRGRLGSLWQFAIVIGQLLGLLAGYGVTHWAGSESSPLLWGGAAWRWMFGVVALLGAADTLIARHLPRSPHELIRRGAKNEARALLERLEDAPAAGGRVEAIAQMQRQNQGGRGLRDLRGGSFGLQGIVWTGLLLGAFQQLVGINVVKTYSNTLWRAVGFSTNASFTISITTVAVSVASTMVAMLLIDRIGRKTLLLSGAAALVVSLATLAFALSTASGSGADLSLDREAGIAALIAMNVFAVAFGVTWGPVMWVMLGELFDSNLRTTAVAVCTAANWMINWLVTRTFPLLAEVGLGLAYGLYAGLAFLALLFVWRKLPETKGRSLG
jgi:SP family sugar:H+ symporter-like MFS transporter